MKKHYTLLLVILLGLLSALPVVARDFEYTYEGQTLTYTVIDPVAKTCRTKAGEGTTAGNNISGDLKIPSIALNEEVEYTVIELGYAAFQFCHGLTSVNIPNSVTTIGDGAFSNCSGLTSVEIPGSVTIIDTSAFQCCSGLTSIEIPGSVTTIGNYAFYECSGLTSIDVDPSNSIYASIDGVLFNKDLSTLITFPARKAGDYAIPNSVTTLGDCAFDGCSGLTSITIPGSVTAIASGAFRGCSGLTYVKIPNSITSIGYAAFSGCSSLSSVEIPNSVTTISIHAFSYCNGLTSVTIPSSVTTIGYCAFGLCSDLTEIEVESSNQNYASVDGVLFSKDLSTLVAFPAGRTGDYTIPNSVTTVDIFAFCDCNGLTSVEIPASISEIGYGVFDGCEAIRTVKYTAMEPCTAERNVFKQEVYDNAVLMVPEAALDKARATQPWRNFATIQAIEEPDVNEFEYTYEGQTITYTVIDKAAKTVKVKEGNWAASHDVSGTLILPEHPKYGNVEYTLKEIGSFAFRYCWKLTEVTIPNSVEVIDDFAFQGCGLTELTLPESVKTIGWLAFGQCGDLTEVTIPGAVNYITQGAFEGCESLENIFVAESNQKYTSVDGVLFNKDVTLLVQYPGGRNGDYVIPSTVKEIEAYAFSGCRGLTSVTLPNSISTISQQAFDDCISLTSVTIPESVTTIESGVFWYCSSLKEVIIPESVTKIQDYAFHDCTGLTSVTIPASVRYILPGAFDGCSGLETMRIKGDRVIDPQTDNNDCTFFVPASVIEEYRSQFPEKTFVADTEDVAANFSAAAEGIEMGHGDTAVLTLSLGKADEINGFQTDLTLPEGLTIAQNSRGKLNVTLGEGTSLKSHALAAQKVSGNNRYRIMVYSTKLETFVSGEGLLNITLESDDTFAGGEIIIDSTELNFAADYTEKPGEVRVPVSMLLYGDANDNGRLAIDDVVTEVLYIMENDPQPFSFKKADINRDMAISIADVMKTAGLVLNSSTATPAMNTVASASAAATTREGEAPLTLGKVEFSNGKALLTISLGNVDDLTALQGTLILPEGVSVTDITLADAQVDRDHIVDHVENSATRVSFAVYSLTADTLEPDAQVLDVELSCTDSFKGGNITLDGIMLVDTKAHGVEYDKVEVAVPDPAIATGIATVTAGDNAGVDVYNMQGILLMRHATAADIRTLAPGLYIIGGEKALIK